MQTYFIHDGQSELGPFTQDELKSRALSADTKIWYEGLEQWTRLADLPALQSLCQKRPTPPPFPPNNHEREKEPIVENDNEYTTAMETYFAKPTGRRRKTILIAGTVLLLAAIIFWQVNRQTAQTETIQQLQQEITEREQSDAQQKLLAQQAALALEEKNRNYRNNWDRYIKLSYTEPRISYTFGGISEFQVDIANRTEYMIDQLDLRVLYIRKSGEVWQTKDVSFFNIPAGSSDQKIAPESVNGVKVEVIVDKIICRKMNFCYPIGVGGRTDPYFCE